MTPEMKRRTAHLKYLVERRAKADGDVIRLLGIMKELGKELAASKRLRSSIDDVIRDYNPKLRPGKIKPVRGSRRFAGKRGDLLAALVAVLAESAPDAPTTKEIAVEIARRLKLNFPDQYDFWNWEHDSVGKQLKRLVKQGRIERVVDPEATTIWAVARWRLLSGSGLSVDRLLERFGAADAIAHTTDDGRD